MVAQMVTQRANDRRNCGGAIVPWVFGGGAIIALGGGIAYLASHPTVAVPASTATPSALAVEGVTLSDPTVSGVASVSPTAGGIVTASVGLKNTGQESGSWSVLGYTVLSGAGPSGAVQGHLGQASSPATPVTGGPLSGGATTSATLTSAPITYGNNIANYSSASGLDLYVTVKDTTTGQSILYLVPSAIFLPMQTPSVISLYSISLSAT